MDDIKLNNNLANLQNISYLRLYNVFSKEKIL